MQLRPQTQAPAMPQTGNQVNVITVQDNQTSEFSFSSGFLSELKLSKCSTTNSFHLLRKKKQFYYLKALNCCQDIVFTHGVWIGGWVPGKILPSLYL